MSDFEFIKQTDDNDIDYFKQVLSDAEKIRIYITWGFDEQQADPFHRRFNTDEFIRRLKRLIEERK